MHLDVYKRQSLRSEATRKYVYRHILEYQKTHKIVLVVSAMGRYPDAYATDTLLSLGSEYLSKEEKARLVSMGEQLSTCLLYTSRCV